MQRTTKTPLALLTLAMLTGTASADVLRCKIDGSSQDISDTNQGDGQYARIGISPGIGNRASVFADRMGAHVFVERIGLLTQQKDMRVVKSNQSIDPSGMVSGPSQSAGVCTQCASLRAVCHDDQENDVSVPLGLSLSLRNTGRSPVPGAIAANNSSQ